MPFLRRQLPLALLLFLIFSARSWGLSQNNVRVTPFAWMHAQTEHFDVYYNQGDERLVPIIADRLEKAWRDDGETLNFYVPGRTPFFLFSNHNEFEQTNIVPIDEGTGGVTEAAKNRLLIFNDGSMEWLRHVIPHEFGHVVEFNILYGGFWKSARLLKSPFYPLWVMEGISEYVAGEVDAPAGDMVVRDAVANNRLPELQELQGFSHLKPGQVTLGYKTGEAAFQFLVDEYGRERVHDLLYELKDYFDVSSALESMIGIDLVRFDWRFHEWERDRYRHFLEHAKPPSFYGPQVTASDGIPQQNTAPALSPDGKTLYYFSDKSGFSEIYAYDFDTKTAQRLIEIRWSKFEYLEPGGRALSVSPNGRWLAFVGERKEQDYLYIYDLERKKLKRSNVPFGEFRSPTFSPVDDNVLVCVGMIHGFNDLYLMNRDGKILKRLTDNPQDEKSPTFTPDGKRVVYSAEQLNPGKTEPAGWDLYEQTIADGGVKRLTALDGSELDPEVLPDGSIVFVRDRDDSGNLGFNLYQLDPSSSSAPVRLTDFIGGGFTPRYSPARRKLYYDGFYKGERQVFEGNWAFERAADADAKRKSQPELADNDTWGDPPRSPNSRMVTQTLQSWQFDPTAPIFSASRPYRFTASTDLFLPLLFYSTDQGLALVDIWQYSELMGNHQLQQQMQYASGADLLDLSVYYTYARFRPQFTIGVQTQKYFMDVDKTQQRHQTDVVGLMTYPLDRVNSVDLGVGMTDRRDRDFDDPTQNVDANERFWTAGFTHDTISGRYLEPTHGHQLTAFYQQSFEKLGGNQEYKSGGFQTVHYTPIPRESTLVSRVFYGRSVGDTPQVFRLGGVDRIRGLSQESDDHKKSNVVLGSLETRIRIKYLDYRTKFLFPDFFFKAAYLVLFDDAGYGWDSAEERDDLRVRSAENSAGVGVTWPTFILQSYRIDFSVQWAHRTTTGSDVWYISLGPSF